MIAERGIDTERRTQSLQMRLHIFCVEGAHIVVNHIPRQQDDVHLFLRHQRSKAIQFACAVEEIATEMNIGSDADTQRRHRFRQRHLIMAHDRRIGVKKPPGKKRYKARRQKHAQQPCRPLRGKSSADAVQRISNRCHHEP